MIRKTALSRGIAILESVSLTTRPLRFSELRAIVPGVPDSTLSRLLRSLESSGHLARHADMGYTAGPETRRWMTAIRQSPSRFHDVVIEQLKFLTTTAKESAAVALLDDEAIRIFKSQAVPEAVSIISEGEILYFDTDHAGCLAILHQLDRTRRAEAFKSRYSRIHHAKEYAAAIRTTRLKSGFWLDRSRARPGICRIALGFTHNGQPGTIFLCLTVESAQRHWDFLSRALRTAQKTLQDVEIDR